MGHQSQRLCDDGGLRSQRDRRQKLKKESMSEKLGGKNYKDRH